MCIGSIRVNLFSAKWNRFRSWGAGGHLDGSMRGVELLHPDHGNWACRRPGLLEVIGVWLNTNNWVDEQQGRVVLTHEHFEDPQVLKKSKSD